MAKSTPTPTSTSTTTTPSCTLPPEKVFPIQIGTDLFRLSGASIASDSPSYFSRFFEDQIRQNAGNASNLRTLYIDRDPGTFREIALHLQDMCRRADEKGYHIQPRDSTEFVKLFADAQFYNLPRLTSQLFTTDIYIQIDSTDFRFPRDIFSTPGNTPNYFSLGFGAFFASPTEVFPGLDRTGLLRPPAIEPPRLPHRSAAVFADLLQLARGYPVAIRGAEHRAQLVRDCRYFNLKGLEQQIIACDVGRNPVRGRGEIVIGAGDIVVRGMGIGLVGVDSDEHAQGQQAWATYMRPYTDDGPNDLIVQIADDNAVIDLADGRITFLGSAEGSMRTLLATVLKEAIASGSFDNDPDIQPENRPRVQMHDETDLRLNGQQIDHATSTFVALQKPRPADGDEQRASKRPRLDPSAKDSAVGKWYVRTGQWLVHISKPGQDVEVALVAVKLDVYTGARERTRTRPFLVS